MNEMRTDADLVTAHLAGDRGALAVIYQRYGATLFDTAAAMLGDRDEAADVTQDVFLVSAERLGQLRDPSRLKPWLFAVLRNEVYRRTKKRRRTVLTDFSEPTAAMVLPPAAEGVSDQVEELVSGDELAELVRGAARGLDERDQLVLELTVRQNLGGADLADALGVSAQQSYGLVHRMRERTERSLAAFCVARAGRRDCAELDAILHDWDGEFTVLIRKRVARHIDSCETCERTRRKVAPLALFGAAPAFAAPPDLWDRISERLGLGSTEQPPYEFDAEGGFPGMVRARRGLVLWLGATAALVLLLVVGIVAGVAMSRDDGSVSTAEGATTTLAIADPKTDATTDATDDAGTVAAAPAGATSSTGASTSTSTSTSTTTSSSTSTSVVPGSTAPPATVAPVIVTATTATTAPRSTTLPPPPPPPPPAALSLSAANLDFGSAASSANVTLSNTGGSAASWTVSGSAAPFGLSPTSGSLAPGASVLLTATLDRSTVREGVAPSASVSFTAAGSASPNLVLSAGTVMRPPVITPRSPGATVCLPSNVVFNAMINDESPINSASVTGTKGNGTTFSVTLSPGSSGWTATLTPQTFEIGTWSWRMTAVDSFDNRGTATGQFQLTTC